MAQPSPYNRQASFTTIQQEAPSDSLPGATVDAELNAVKATIDQILQNIALIQRDDGALATGSVGREQLAASITLGFNSPSAWHADVNYTSLDTAFFEGVFYRSTVSHLSSVFATDLAAGRWEIIADFAGVIGTAVNVGVTPTGTLGSTNAQDALEELQADIDTINATDIMASPPLVPTQATSDDSTKAASTAFVQDRAAEIEAAAIAAAITPSGVVTGFAGASAPTGWLLCYGQAVSRTTYEDLFDAIGETHGAGDGSTTFNVPDLRGRAVAGKDDMGGSAASRLTSGGSGLDGASLGASGGAQTHTLTEAQIAAHDHDITDPGHVHDLKAINFGANRGTPSNNYLGSDTIYTDTTTPKQTMNSGSIASGTTGVTVNSAGGGGAHNNVQPTLVLNFIIKT